MAKRRRRRKSTRKSSRKKPRKKSTRRTTRKRNRSSRRRKHSFPKNPRKGETKTITVRGRKVTFRATGKKGFGAWRIVSSTK